MENKPADKKLLANDGIVNKDVLKSVAEQLKIDKQASTIETLRNLEPLLYRDILASVMGFKKTYRALGLPLDVELPILDLFATAMIRGFLIYKTAISKVDGDKLRDIYNVDWDKYCDELIDRYYKDKPHE